MNIGPRRVMATCSLSPICSPSPPGLSASPDLMTWLMNAWLCGACRALKVVVAAGSVVRNNRRKKI
ncbi:hypothetical protein E2C01_054615 [Portunus trituberculatus]|uniref:Uncharacterized protein n=1 Tax=Portunus trituberculatus TaxID=210409 RepID=A0A5B7GSG6_PORTR|nr:hypothetical protein [Portunus trituberculatus]